MDVIVRKYGGSSLATPEQILQTAQQIAQLHREGHPTITVVSAMGKTTDELVQLAYKVSSHPNRRELDMLLTTGERISMSLLSMALHDLNCPAISFTGSQAGVFTNDDHSDALIHELKPIRVVEALENHRPVVLAGYQGVDPKTKEITTLGRGGSDTTAVAMAGYFQSKRCEILKDVNGLASADPKLVPTAHFLKEVSYNSLLEMCFWGSKILHIRSVELAKNLNVPLFIGSSSQPNIGTRVVKETKMYEDFKILSVNSHKEVVHFRIQSSNLADGFSKWNQFLKTKNLPSLSALASIYDKNEKALRFMFTADSEIIHAIQQSLSSEFSDITDMNLILSSVTITANQRVNEGTRLQAMTALAEAGISIEKMLTTPLSCTFFVSPSQREDAICCLHSLTFS